MKTNAFGRALSAAMLIVFSTHSFVWAGPKPELTLDRLLQQVVTQYDQARSLEAFVHPKGHINLISKNDIKYLESQLGHFAEVKKQLGVGRRGNTLVFTLGAEKTTLAIEDLAELKFTVNGKHWQANPFLSVEANVQSLKSVLTQKTSLLERLWSVWVPDAQAFVEPITALIVVVVAVLSILAGLAWRSITASGYVKIDCMPTKDREGNNTFKIGLKWRDSVSNSQGLVIDPTNPAQPLLTDEFNALTGQAKPLCVLDANWDLTKACPVDRLKKVGQHLPKLKNMLSICADPGKLEQLNRLLPGNARVGAKEVNSALHEGGKPN